MSHALRFCVVAAILATSFAANAQSSVETIAAVSPKVVKIFGAGGGQKLHAYGSGFLVSPNGHIVTVWSHILDGDTVTICPIVSFNSLIGIT